MLRPPRFHKISFPVAAEAPMGPGSSKRLLGCFFIDPQLLVPSLEFRPPPLTLVKVFGAPVIGKHRERQLGEAIGPTPVFGRLEQGTADSAAFRLARHC